MPSLNDLILWGVPLVGFVGAITAFIRWVFPGIAEQVVTSIGAVLVAFLSFFTMNLETFLSMWPGLATWGPSILWSLCVMLMYTGHYPLSARVKAFVSRRL